MFQELIPIIALIGVALAALAVAIILKIRSKKSLLIEQKVISLTILSRERKGRSMPILAELVGAHIQQ